MWLLSTDRAELHYFIDPNAVPGGYAILSHVWGKDEQSFKEIQKLKKKCNKDGTNPRDHCSEKVRRICRIAEQDRLRWLWDDTCCINKDSSSELSEAINSMYRYYSLAAVCYAYLADVPSDSFSDDRTGPFAQSKWHRRGWTLQELIAAAVVEFISPDWQKLGTKMQHASLLSRITKIPVDVLLMEKPVSDFSVAQRMSWAYGRKTTRVEDRAYSLMGIFSVNMTTLYGEGKRAFQRLQEEIMKQSIDPSLFAWGDFRSRSGRELAYITTDHWHAGYGAYLLARSPDDFRPAYSGRTSFSPIISEAIPADSEWNKIPTFTMTPYGCLSHLVCFDVGELTLAWTACHWDGGGKALPLWLPLLRCPDPPPDESRPLYHCGYGHGLEDRRLVVIRDTDWPSQSVDFHRQEFHIALWHTTPKTTSSPIPVALEHERIRTPFRITWEFLSDMLGLAPRTKCNLDTVPIVRFDWDGHIPIAFHASFDNYPGGVILSGIWLVFGVCDSVQPGQHFARYYDHPSHESPSPDEYLTHSCEWDHISTWPEGKDHEGHPDGSRTTCDFQYGYWSFGLSFTPCPLYGPSVLVLGPKKRPADQDAYNKRMEEYGAYIAWEAELRLQRQLDLASASLPPSMGQRPASSSPPPPPPPSQALSADAQVWLDPLPIVSTMPQATHSE
ncbi:heterokaryon incompatibility protein-domain-containing protein [Dichomitus squalens]|uniref:Heterokaryon incompatibility protein-domain-containing protein n=1 Tax=Dichomitus squalens TaxID=114155 RepID=A0A4Q9MP26_9APHY|nr:heterokaryon incompatibility protein-domain-containing protein [Dichomitus squalens]